MKKKKKKENEMVDKYLDLARKMKKLWNMRVKVILTVLVAIGMVLKNMVNGQVESEINGRKKPYKLWLEY